MVRHAKPDVNQKQVFITASKNNKEMNKEPKSKPFVLVPEGAALNYSPVPMKPPATAYESHDCAAESEDDRETWIRRVSGRTPRWIRR